MLTWGEARCDTCETTTWVLLEKCQVHGFPLCRRFFAVYFFTRQPINCPGQMRPTGRIEQPRRVA